jgi:hypothetical protein
LGKAKLAPPVHGSDLAPDKHDVGFLLMILHGLTARA